MISISVLFWLLVTHWVADFVFQTDWMAQNKSKNNYPLFIHVCTYSAILFIILSPIASSSDLIVFALLNGILHFIIDFFTSRLSSKLYREGKLGSSTIPNFGFFSVIGLDQLLHYLCLFTTFGIFLV